MPSKPGSIARSAPRVLIATLVVATVYLLLVTFSEWRACRFYTHDVGHDNYMLYYTWHGRFFWSIVHQCPHFAKHFTPTYILLVPFHAIFQHMLMLPLMETLSVCAGAWAVVLITEHFLKRGRRIGRVSPISLAVGLLYLAHPNVGGIVLSNHFEAFTVGFGLWTLLALLRYPRWVFWCLLLLTLGCKEDMAIYWAPLGLWWILFGESRGPEKGWRGRWKVGAAIFVVALVWFGIAELAIRETARLTGQPLFEYASRYEWLGTTPGQMAANLLRHPGVLLIPCWRALAILLPGALLLPILRPATLLMLIVPAWLMGWSTSELQTNLLYYYAYPFIPFLFFGVAGGAARLAQWLHARKVRGWGTRTLSVTLLVGAAVWACLPTSMEGHRRVPFRASARDEWKIDTLNDVLPRNSSVAAQFNLLCYLPFCRDMMPLSEKNLDRAEYWVFDYGPDTFLGDITSAQFRAMIDRAQKAIEAGTAEMLMDWNGVLIIHNKQVTN